MSPDVGFPVFLGVTVVLLTAVVITGLKSRVRAHLCLVAAALASIGMTIWYAEQLGELYDLESAGAIMPVHLALAKITVFAYLLPIVTGVLTLRDRKHKRAHFTCAMVALVLTVLATVTGTWMVLAAERL